MKLANLGALAFLVLVLAAHEAQAARFCARASGCSVVTTCGSCVTHVPDGPGPGTTSPPSYPPTVVAYRQCRVVYFDAKSSAWFESDALVVAEYAVAGLLVHDAKIPGVGYVRAWVKDVYEKPRLTPPA